MSKLKPSGLGPTADVIFFVGVTKKTKQKKARAWRRARHSRLTVPLFADTPNLVNFVCVALQLDMGCMDQRHR
ncbi:MAG: hypothetical protein C0615_10610 [Desulfuromonas sp.]|nr:MAG: hypothetical protein C0615_10610 [Desulfuromonas sp.]